MTPENIKNELRRINEDLHDLFELVRADYSSERRYALSRYNMGVMVGIGYARKELERLEQYLIALKKKNTP